MTSSLPTRNSMSPFRRSNSSMTIDTTYKKKHSSLKIITTTSTTTTSSATVVKDENNHVMSSPSVRQRISSLFRTSSPVVLNLKESFSNKRASLSSISFSPSTTAVATVEEGMEPLDDSHSTTTSISSDSVDHMPSSPADTKALTSTWQPSVTMLSFEPTIKEEDHPFAVTPSSSSLAYQVNQILGSTLDEVDEEIDRDWENSRNMLRQSLVPSPLNNRNQWL